MNWVGKVVGGLLGFAAGGPVGSLLGVVLGHQFDRGLGMFGRSSVPPSGRLQALYSELTFEIMGYLAKSDGRVSEQEISVARRAMHAMRLSPEEVKAAIEHFTRGKSPGYPLAERLRVFRRELGDRTDLAGAFMQIQMQALVAAGDISKAKREALWKVASRLDVGRVQLAQFEALARAQSFTGAARRDRSAELVNAYRVLGVEEGASDQAIKTAYRRLMNQHHPDKLVARGLPSSMARVAEEKTHEIRAAYERIREHRDLK
jgi:DnaJ like chaperone protein